MAFGGMVQAKKKAGRWVLYALFGSLCFVSSACDQTEKVQQSIEQRSIEAQEGLSAAEKRQPHGVTFDPLTVTNKVWSGNAAIRMQRGMPLPARFEDAHGVTLVSSTPMTMSELAAAITAHTGIPVRLSSMTMPGKSGVVAQASNAPEMPTSYEGSLSGLLDRMSAFFGISWRFDGTAISISRYETRIFSVEALPGTLEINEGMQDDVTSSSSSGSSSGGGAVAQQNTLTQNSKTTMNLKYWEELTAVLNSIIGSNGSAIVSPTMGTVTITTTPEIMSTVADYLAKENKRLSRQIAINVHIYSVNLNQSEDFQIAFTTFLKNMSSFSGLNYTSAAAPGFANTNLSVSNLGSLSIAILNGPNDPTAHVGDIFSALSAIGNTSEVAQFPMTTLNNRPVSRRVGTDRTYIATVNSSTTSSTSTTTTYTPVISTIHDGFSLQLTPRLLDDGRILLQYSLSLIGVDTMGPTNFDEGGGVIIPLDLPVTDNRIFVQQSMLRSGQTLIIGGVDQETLIQNKQGVGAVDNFLLGGGASSNKGHLMLFMAITPQVMDVASDEVH